jgi:hypothetical protein
VKRYRIKTTDDHSATLDVIHETDSVLSVRIIRTYDTYTETELTDMTRDLFDMCIRTAYLTETVSEPNTAVA